MIDKHKMLFRIAKWEVGVRKMSPTLSPRFCRCANGLCALRARNGDVGSVTKRPSNARPQAAAGIRFSSPKMRVPEPQCSDTSGRTDFLQDRLRPRRDNFGVGRPPE